MCVEHVVGECVDCAFKVFSRVRPFTNEVDEVEIDDAVTVIDQRQGKPLQ